MKFEELLENLRSIDNDLVNKYPLNSQKEAIMGAVLKLIEETGEFANELLGSWSLQRKSKMGQYKQENLAKEWADVFFALCMIAFRLGVSPEQAVQTRLEEIKERQDQQDL